MLAAAAAPACEGIDDAAPGIEVGKVAATWTIDGSRDPQACVEHGIERMRFLVVDPYGGVRASAFVRCDAFGASASVRAGLYSATATFVDDAGEALSATVERKMFPVDGREATPVTFAFTRDAMSTRGKNVLAPP